MTSQDVRQKTFEKAVFGGYDMGAVDDFMDAVASEIEDVEAKYESARKKVGELEAKLKIVVASLKEYGDMKANDEAMRKALVSAQMLSAQIEKDAKEKAEKLLSDAEASAREKISAYKREIEGEQDKLMAAKAETAKYFEQQRTLCNRQLDFLDKVANMATVGSIEETVIDDAVRSIESSVSRIPNEPEINIHIGQAPSADSTQAIDPEGLNRLFE